jgi:hypothetical protein
VRYFRFEFYIHDACSFLFSLLRCGTSIGANYREAFRARSKAEWSERDERLEGKAARVAASGQRANQFIAKCGDSLREIEEWSALGDRGMDGQTRKVAGKLPGTQRVKAPIGWNCLWNRELSA